MRTLILYILHQSLFMVFTKGLCINEFAGLDFEPDPSTGRGMRTGSDVLRWLSFHGSSVPRCLLGQARILAFYYWATFCILRAKRNTFLQIEPLATTPSPVSPPGLLVMKELPPADSNNKVLHGETAAHVHQG